ncbi:MAG TPA: FlaD/FlaE family flagellar protein [Candidatus Methanoperedens sp.]
MLEELEDNSIETQRKWIKFLLERVGHNNLPRLLNYYKSIGWISDPVVQRLLELASIEKRYKGVSWTLSAQEQRISRLYIEKLKGHNIEESLLQIPFPGKARPDMEKKVEIRTEQYLHPVEKKKMEFNIHRRDVTISNLEKELDEKYTEIEALNERIRELEAELLESNKELMRNKIYMEIMDQNIRIKKIARKKPANLS